MEFVVACGRRRGPPLERLAAHGAILHFGLVKGFWVAGQSHSGNLKRTGH